MHYPKLLFRDFKIVELISLMLPLLEVLESLLGGRFGYVLFFPLGEGGESEALGGEGGGGNRFVLKIPGEGGGFQERGRGAGRVSVANWGILGGGG